MSRSFKAKGIMKFVYTSQGLTSIKLPLNKLVEDYPLDIQPEVVKMLEKSNTFEVHDMMTGIGFLECVKCCGFTDYDGTLHHIYIDGFDSNLGLMAYGLCQGEFLVDDSTFEEICKKSSCISRLVQSLVYSAHNNIFKVHRRLIMKRTFEVKGLDELVYDGKKLVHYKTSRDHLVKLADLGGPEFFEMISPEIDTLIEGSEFVEELKSGQIKLNLTAAVRHIFIDDYLARLVVYRTDPVEDAGPVLFTYNYGTSITDNVFLELCKTRNVYVDVDSCYIEDEGIQL